MSVFGSRGGLPMEEVTMPAFGSRGGLRMGGYGSRGEFNMGGYGSCGLPKEEGDPDNKDRNLSGEDASEKAPPASEPAAPSKAE